MMNAMTRVSRQLSWSAVCSRRLDRHGLSTALAASPADVVRAMCGAHAQVLTAAELSIGLRIAGATRADVHEALWTDRTLVKTRGPRGTVHLLASHDLPMWTGALSALPVERNTYPDGIRMTPEQVDEVIAAIETVLADAELTVDELTDAIVGVTGSWAGDLVIDAFQVKWPRWRQIEHVAANRGALCFGPTRGRKVTYTSPARWLPGFSPADGTTALAELVTRYLHAYGPATPQHFAQWMSVPRRWAADLFDSLGDALEQVHVDGTAAWQLAGEDDATAAAPSGVRLLPYFDAYTVGCHPRELLFPGAASARALAGGQAGNFPVLLIDGVVAGVWHQRRAGRKLAVTVEPIGRLTARHRRELDVQVERIAAFFDAKLELTIGPVNAGAHA